MAANNEETKFIKKSYRMKQSFGAKLFDVSNYIFMLFIILIMFLPMWHVICISFTSGKATMGGNLTLWPKEFSTLAYEEILKEKLLTRSYLNAVIYACGNTFLSLIFRAVTAYPLSVPNFCLKKPITVFLAITMFVSGGLIPTYLLMRTLHLINNPLIMIVTGLLGAYPIILFRTFFSNIDGAIRESAKMDGASEIRILFQMYLPLSKPILAVFGLFGVIGKWNDWFTPYMYLNKEKYHPVILVLRRIMYTSGNNAFLNMDNLSKLLVQDLIKPVNVQMAAVVLSTLPILCLYPFIQKHFTKGVFVGSIKG